MPLNSERNGGLTYMFPVTHPPSTVLIELEPAGPGRFPFEISAGPSGSVTADVWVVP